MEREEQIINNVKYSDITRAMSRDCVRVFCVDTDTDCFVEFIPHEQDERLDIRTIGKDFKETIHSFWDSTYAPDMGTVRTAFTKKNILNVLEVDDFFTLNYRMMIDGNPTYVRLKATRLHKEDPSHVVLALNNIEANLPRLQKYEQMQEIANRDSLTGVKSKHAFSVDVERINTDIEKNESVPFAVVVCDVNGLKKINDTRGHQAGDDYLCQSCKMICDVFSHSPVYRIGGDEFAIILMGRDFQNRSKLIQELHNLSTLHIGTNEAVVSCGMAEYVPDQDHYIRDIFERADAIMYKEKILLKSLGAAARDKGTDKPEQYMEEIPVINIRKHILIADDQAANREILGHLLKDDYDILMASNGIETMEMLRKHKNDIALLLLDLYMPVMTGREVIKEMQVDEELMAIPVIMLTVDHDAELDSLRIGAMDFISKPYPDIDIIKARISKCIERSESRDMVRNTQRDRLTGLLHFSYFIRYVDRFDHQFRGNTLDAFVCDIKHFHLINEQYGRQFGDLVLRDIGINIRKLARKTGGIACRQNEDTFLLYCPHQKDYEQLITWFCADLFVDKETAGIVELRFGVFLNADREPDIEKRFSLAKIAAANAPDTPEIKCGYYSIDPLQ